jgi:hypothetical protein
VSRAPYGDRKPVGFSEKSLFFGAICALVCRWGWLGGKFSGYRRDERIYRTLVRIETREDSAESLRRRWAHAQRMREKYEHAIWRPWLPVAPDPTEPE